MPPSDSRTVRQQLGVGAAYFTYDENGNRLKAQDLTGTVYWTYDGMDRMIKEEGA